MPLEFYVYMRDNEFFLENVLFACYTNLSLHVVSEPSLDVALPPGRALLCSNTVSFRSFWEQLSQRERVHKRLLSLLLLDIQDDSSASETMYNYREDFAKVVHPA
jgi:hypothetical protein